MLLLTNRARTWSSMLFTTLTATRKQRQKSTEHCMYPNVFVYVGLSELHVKCIEGLSQHLAQYYGWNTYMSVSANTALRALVLQGCFSSTSTIFRRYRGTLQRDMAAICFGDCYRSTASFYLHHVLRKSICIHRKPSCTQGLGFDLWLNESSRRFLKSDIYRESSGRHTHALIKFNFAVTSICCCYLSSAFSCSLKPNPTTISSKSLHWLSVSASSRISVTLIHPSIYLIHLSTHPPLQSSNLLFSSTCLRSVYLFNCQLSYLSVDLS